MCRITWRAFLINSLSDALQSRKGKASHPLRFNTIVSLCFSWGLLEFSQIQRSWKNHKKNRSPAQVGCMRQVLRAGALGRPRGMGWSGRREGGSGRGTHVNPWLIHVNEGRILKHSLFLASPKLLALWHIQFYIVFHFLVLLWKNRCLSYSVLLILLLISKSRVIHLH